MAFLWWLYQTIVNKHRKFFIELQQINQSVWNQNGTNRWKLNLQIGPRNKLFKTNYNDLKAKWFSAEALK